MAILKVANVHHDASGFTRTQTTTANTIAWFTSNVEQARLDPRGNVGIGTATPNEKVVVSDNRERVRTSIINTNTVTGSIGDIVAFSNNSNQYTTISSSAGGGGALTSHNPTGFTIQNVGPAYANTPIAFRTNNSERVRIDGLGRVGIGTDSPTNTLDVVGTTQTSYLTIGTNQTLPAANAAIYRPVSDSLAFVTQSTERMRITSLGRVGVGRGDPGYEFDVVGTVNASAILQNGGLLTSISNSYAVLVGQSANSRAVQVGLSANAYAEQIGASANANASVVGISANSYALSVASSKVASVTGTSGRITSSGGTTPVIDLSTAGAGAASYSSGISAISVDAYGRVTSVTGSAGYITSSGSITGSAGTFTSTTQNSRFNSIGVGAATASGVAGEIRASDNITAYASSDKRLKENIRDIHDAVSIVSTIGGKYFDWKDEYIDKHGGEDGYFLRKSDFGVIAQDVQGVFPVAVRERSDSTLAVDYEKLVALAFAAIKELKAEIDELKKGR